MSKCINQLKINLIRYRSKVTIPCGSSRIELENNRNLISSSKIHLFWGIGSYNEYVHLNVSGVCLRKNRLKFHSETDSGMWKNLAHSEALLALMILRQCQCSGWYKFQAAPSSLDKAKGYVMLYLRFRIDLHADRRIWNACQYKNHCRNWVYNWATCQATTGSFLNPTTFPFNYLR